MVTAPGLLGGVWDGDGAGDGVLACVDWLGAALFPWRLSAPPCSGPALRTEWCPRNVHAASPPPAASITAPATRAMIFDVERGGFPGGGPGGTGQGRASAGGRSTVGG